MPKQKVTAVLLPGFGGTVRQPLLVRLGAELRRHGFAVSAFAPKRGAPTPGLEAEQAQLERHLKRLGARRTVWLGRSFGGRVCARLAVKTPPLALVLLGFPVRPPGKRRPLDEAALAALSCPTLLLQGSRDPLAPVKLLTRIAEKNPRLTLEVVAGAAHAYGRHERGVVARAAQWLEAQISRPRSSRLRGEAP